MGRVATTRPVPDGLLAHRVDHLALRIDRDEPEADQGQHGFELTHTGRSAARLPPGDPGRLDAEDLREAALRHVETAADASDEPARRLGAPTSPTSRQVRRRRGLVLSPRALVLAHSLVVHVVLPRRPVRADQENRGHRQRLPECCDLRYPRPQVAPPPSPRARMGPAVPSDRRSHHPRALARAWDLRYPATAGRSARRSPAGARDFARVAATGSPTGRCAEGLDELCARSDQIRTTILPPGWPSSERRWASAMSSSSKVRAIVTVSFPSSKSRPSSSRWERSGRTKT